MIVANSHQNNHTFVAPVESSQVSRVVSECLQTLRLFIEPGQVTQLIALDVTEPGLRVPQCVGGYFDYDHLDLMAREAADLSGSTSAVYFTLNPLMPEALARCQNRIQRLRPNQAASDRDVQQRRWLMIDIDPSRLAGISATDSEKASAFELLEQIQVYLCSLGFGEPIIADSGNGYHLYYRIDLPTGDTLPHRILQALSTQFSTSHVTIDTSVASAAQLTKVFGTLAAKGDSTDERPHRFSRIMSIPTAASRTPRGIL